MAMAELSRQAIDAYLARIGYHGALEPTAEVLAGLHRAHLLAVPFENLSIHTGERIELDVEWLFDKIVGRRRGGFCYELNGLFAALLNSLGFRVSRLAARVRDKNGDLGIPFDHLVLRVDFDDGALERAVLADVGFGDSFVDPLPMRVGELHTEGRKVFRLDQVGDEFDLVEHGADTGWRRRHRFDLAAWSLSDYQSGCHYHQTDSRSPFVKHPLCSLPRADGSRTTIRGHTLIATSADGSRSETELAGEQQWVDALREHFGVILS